MPGRATSHSDIGLPALRISTNGAVLPDEAQNDLLAVRVHEDVGALSMFALQLNNWDDAQRGVKWVDQPLFREGNEVKIQMGYEGAGGLVTVMVGEITGLEPEFSVDEPFTLTVRGYDRRHRLSRGHKTRSFVKMKDSDIARRLASEGGLRPQVVDTKVQLEYVLQHNQTDLEFLHERARRIGYEVVVDDRTLHFRPPPFDKPATVTLSLGDDLAEFSPRLTTMTQVGQLEVHGWDPKQKRAIIGQARAGQERAKMGGTVSGPQAGARATGKSRGVGVQRPVFTQGEADQMAQGALDDIALSFITGDGVCMGDPELRAGIVVNIAGAGRRFSGLYYVTSATHTITAGQYSTAFTVKRNAT
jgi:phage protein D